MFAYDDVLNKQYQFWTAADVKKKRRAQPQVVLLIPDFCDVVALGKKFIEAGTILEESGRDVNNPRVKVTSSANEYVQFLFGDKVTNDPPGI